MIHTSIMERVNQGEIGRYKSEASMKAGYSASRKRCFYTRKKLVLPIAEKTSQVLSFEPLRFYEPHDAHIRVYYDYLHNLLNNGGPDTYSAEQVIREFLLLSPFRYNEIRSRRRHKDLVRWRQSLFHALRQYTPRSYPEMGRIVGGRDHTTALHSVNRVASAKLNGDVSKYISPMGLEFWVRTN